MSLFDHMLHFRRFIVAFVGLSILVGIAAYGTMARQEDPSFPYRPGSIEVVYPGVSAAQIEKLIVEPLEEELLQVEEIDYFRSVSRDNVAIFTILLNDSIYDTDSAWDRVRRAMARAELAFPDGAISMELNDRRMDIPAVVLSVTGSEDPIVLEVAADQIKQRLLSVPGVSRIEIYGEPEKELIIEVDGAELNRLGINRQQVVAALQARNEIIPGGLLNVGEKFIRVNTFSDIQSVEELAIIPIRLPRGQTVPLSAVAQVKMLPKMPAVAQVFHNGERAVQLGIIAVRGQTDIIGFGATLREELKPIAADFAPLNIRETFFQPDFVRARLEDLQGSLVVSTVVIAAVVLLALGWRTGLLVALVLPIVAMITLAIYNLGGGILHQIAIIGIVVSLGILIDNAIVIVESIEKHLREGMEKVAASRLAVKQLAMPLFSSTGTTIAAFIPLLLSKGNTADFTRAIPEMIVIALIVSYVISVMVLPLAAIYWLKRDSRSDVPGSRWIANRVNRIHQYHPFIPLAVVALFLVATATLLPYVKQQFFPSAYRNQIVVDLTFPVGTPVNYTAEKSLQLEQQLQARADVKSVMRAVGTSGPRFYYNLSLTPSAANYSRLMVNTYDAQDNQKVIDWLDQDFQPQMPEATIVAHKLGQGPPMLAPIEVRLQGYNGDDLFKAAQSVMSVLHQNEGARVVRSNMDSGIPELKLAIADYAGSELGITRSDITRQVFSETTGLNSGQYRYSNNPVTMRVRSPQGEFTALESIPSLYLYQGEQVVPLTSVASLQAHWSSAEIHHYNGRPTVNIYSELQPGAAYNQVLSELFAHLEKDPLPASVTLSLGGESEESGDANRAILTSAPVGIGVLLFFMMLQFNSFRRLGIILTTIPLAAVGIIPGLLLMDQPFGFQSLLGVIALIGIVVNNAIVLIDLVDGRLALGETIQKAVKFAIEQRTAPILLTTATTILGLLPLVFSDSTLWPPLASAIISGLAMSTLLTLVAIPSLCILLLKNDQKIVAA